eukprot:gene772-1478_t
MAEEPETNDAVEVVPEEEDSPDWIDEPEDINTQTCIQNRYCFWYMRRQSAASKALNKYEDSVKKVASFQTIEHFWRVYDHLIHPNDHKSSTIDYHLFKNGITPTWEDPQNQRGGKWIVRLKKGLSSRYWEELVLAIIGEQFDVGQEICGAVISIRGSEDIISVWNKNADNMEATDKIRDQIRRILQLPTFIVIEYKKHQDSLSDKSSFRNTVVYRAPTGRSANNDSNSNYNKSSSSTTDRTGNDRERDSGRGDKEYRSSDRSYNSNRSTTSGTGTSSSGKESSTSTSTTSSNIMKTGNWQQQQQAAAAASSGGGGAWKTREDRGGGDREKDKADSVSSWSRSRDRDRDNSGSSSNKDKDREEGGGSGSGGGWVRGGKATEDTSTSSSTDTHTTGYKSTRTGSSSNTTTSSSSNSTSTSSRSLRPQTKSSTDMKSSSTTSGSKSYASTTSTGPSAGEVDKWTRGRVIIDSPTEKAATDTKFTATSDYFQHNFLKPTTIYSAIIMTLLLLLWEKAEINRINRPLFEDINTGHNFSVSRGAAGLLNGICTFINHRQVRNDDVIVMDPTLHPVVPSPLLIQRDSSCEQLIVRHR